MFYIGRQRRIADQISQAHEGSVAGGLLYQNLCLIGAFLQFLRILHSCVVLLHGFFLELVGAADQRKVVVHGIVVEDLVIATFIVGVSIDSRYEARGAATNLGRLIGLGLSLSLHLSDQTGIWNGSIFANRRSVGILSMFLFNLRLIIDLVVKQL
jgi:hypothetical protein